MPGSGSAPQHAASPNTAEPLPGPAGGSDAGPGCGEPPPRPAVRHGPAAQGGLVDWHAADEAAVAGGGSLGAAEAGETSADRAWTQRDRSSACDEEERGLGDGLHPGQDGRRPPLAPAGGARRAHAGVPGAGGAPDLSRRGHRDGAGRTDRDPRGAGAHPQRQQPGTGLQGGEGLVHRERHGSVVHRPWLAVAERDRRELQPPAAGRTAVVGDLRHAGRGAVPRGPLAPPLQPPAHPAGPGQADPDGLCGELPGAASAPAPPGREGADIMHRLS